MDEKSKENEMILSQNPVSFGQSKACYPKTEVLEQPQVINVVVPKGTRKRIAALAAAGNISEAEALERIIRLGLETEGV
jgi:hypothetical protein